jgi:hypothetical protein
MLGRPGVASPSVVSISVEAGVPSGVTYVSLYGPRSARAGPVGRGGLGVVRSTSMLAWCGMTECARSR